MIWNLNYWWRPEKFIQKCLFRGNKPETELHLCVCVCLWCYCWNLERSVTRMNINNQDRVEQETGVNRSCLAPGLMKCPWKGEWRWENPELKVTIRLAFQSFLSKCCQLWLKKGVSGKIPLWIGPGHHGQSYIMHMGAWKAHFSVAAVSSRPNHQNPIWWISEVFSSYCGFQVEQQLGSVYSTFEEWSRFGRTPILPLSFWFKGSVAEVGRQHKVSLRCDSFLNSGVYSDG